MGLKVLHFNSSDQGLLFTSMGAGSVVGAVFVIPWLRIRFSPNPSKKNENNSPTEASPTRLVVSIVGLPGPPRENSALRRHPKFGSRQCPSHTGKRCDNKKCLRLLNERH
jgi:hypothetical protein